MAKLQDFEKFKFVCRQYNVYFDQVKEVDYTLVMKVMLKAYEFHKDIPFEEYVRNTMANPLEYLYSLANAVVTDVVSLDLLNNCFNDKNKVHYGCKYAGKWFFITHSANMFSKRLDMTSYKLDRRPREPSSYLICHDKVMPNKIKVNVGSIQRKVLDEYITKFL